MKTTKTVTIDTKTVGTNFATAGVVRDARTGRTLHCCGVRPNGFTAAAMQDAKTWATEKGYSIVEADD